MTASVPTASDESTPLMRLSGRVVGDVRSDGAVVIGRGPILGDVTANAIVVRGEVHGDLCAALVVVAPEGRVFGRITYGALRTMNGAEVSGALERIETMHISDEVRQLVQEALQPPRTRGLPPAPKPAPENPSSGQPAAREPAPSRSPGKKRLRVGLGATGILATIAIALGSASAESSTGRVSATSAELEDASTGLGWAEPFAPYAEPPPPDESLHVEADPLRDVYWTVPRASTLKDLALHWSVRRSRLASLNPELADLELPAGTRVLVHRFRDGRPARARGRPTAGSLQSGIPMPEGDFWRLRRGRRNIYGTWLTIANLVHAFEAYGRTFPDAPRILIGDISARNGGALRQHKSHQSGRDVDIRFVLRPRRGDHTTNADETRYRRTSKSTIDAEKTWFLVRALIDAGSVDSIFISARVQGWIRGAALRELPKHSVADYFSYISHEPGHTEHMHVRFEEGHRHR